MKNDSFKNLYSKTPAYIYGFHGCKKETYEGFMPFDSVRGTFEEGNEMYPGAGFREKTHTQVCVRNLNCIKGYFIPREMDSRYPLP